MVGRNDAHRSPCSHDLSNNGIQSSPLPTCESVGGNSWCGCKNESHRRPWKHGVIKCSVLRSHQSRCASSPDFSLFLYKNRTIISTISSNIQSNHSLKKYHISIIITVTPHSHEDKKGKRVRYLKYTKVSHKDVFFFLCVFWFLS